MAKRPAHTLVFLGARRTDRVDLGAAPAFNVAAQQHLTPAAGSDPVTQLETALVTGGRPGKVVWILWEGIGAQMLDMPAGVIEGLEPEQLNDSMSFEAEPLTSVPATDSAIAGVAQSGDTVPDFKRFWIAQTTAALRTKFEDAITKLNAKLGGIAHPGGLPRATWDVAATKSATEWRRVEIWDPISIVLHGKPDGSVDTRVLRSRPGADGGSSGLVAPTDWFDLGARVDTDAQPPLNEDGLPISLNHIAVQSDEPPVEWLRAWAAELTATPRRVPVVVTVSKVSPNRKFWLVGGLSAALVVAGVVGHAGLVTLQIEKAKERADQSEAIQKANTPKDNSGAEENAAVAETDKLQPKLKTLDQRESQLVLEVDRIEKASAEVASRQSRLDRLQSLHRPAVPGLLAALSEAERHENTAEIVVKDVRQDGSGDLRLTGLCRQSSLADAFATKLEGRLGPAGWKVGAAQKRLRDDRLAFDFTVVLTPQILAEPQGEGTPLASPLRDGVMAGNLKGGRRP